MSSVVDTRPSTNDAALVGGVGTVGAVTLLTSPNALVFGLLGTLLFAGGTAVGAGRVVSLGLVASLGGVVVGALTGVGVVFVVAATTCFLVAWDAANQALALGETVGREAVSQRALSVHAAVAGGVASVAAGVGYGVYLAVGGGRPVGALVLLLVGAVLLASALR
ncbi:hypothetical protein ACFPYI_06090 [Halomarina salina]|uniref:Uncharacterized protein n=1 Tax=Halomarina salina TaxID=1872699 RepID=A0ABD5RKK4_9EURY|nr:hypothetical protein [Halomarina salina]